MLTCCAKLCACYSLIIHKILSRTMGKVNEKRKYLIFGPGECIIKQTRKEEHYE